MAEEVKVVEIDTDDDIIISIRETSGICAMMMPDKTEYIMSMETAEYIAFEILNWLKRYED